MTRTLLLLLTVGGLILPTTSSAEPPPPSCTAQTFHAFSAAVWDTDHWRRAHPPASILKAERQRLGCAPPAHRQAMKRTWRRDAERFHAFRHNRLMHQRWEPIYCGPGEVTFDPGNYAIPCHNVNAESGGRGGPYCNTYGVIGGADEPNASNPTWIEWGGLEFASSACGATELEQSIVARRLFEAHGSAPWDPFE